MRTRATVLSMLALAMLGVLLWGGPVANLWARAFADPCPASAHAPDCVAELPAHVTNRWDSVSDNEAVLSLDIPDSPTAYLTVSEANRIGVRTDDDVRVTVFDREVVEVTAASGQRAETETRWFAAALRFLAASAVAILIVMAVAHRLGVDPRRAALCAAIGTVAGLCAGTAVSTTLTMPVTFAVAIIVSVAVSFTRQARPLTNTPFT
jgi:hypothetical protein